MLRIQLIHWNAQEAKERKKRLITFGYLAETAPLNGADAIRAAAKAKPDVILIDLTRLPSHGREVGSALRRQKATRRIPLVFVGGEPEKVARVRSLLPDATYASWSGIRATINGAFTSQSAQPKVPTTFAFYEGRPVSAKLGIKPETVVCLINAPVGFVKSLGQLPPGVHCIDGDGQRAGLSIWFVRDRRELKRGMKKMAARTPLWIAWPKKASGIVTDVSEREVRAVGLAAGIVDCKICSISEIWSGLLFRQRRT